MAEVRHLGLFPFCIGEYPPIVTASPNTNPYIPTGPHSLYQFTLKTEDAMAFWWRIKEWKLSFTFSDYNDLSITDGRYAGSYERIFPINIELYSTSGFLRIGLKTLATKETDLICLSGFEENAYEYGWQWQAQRVGEITYPPDPETGIQPPPTPINYTHTSVALVSNNIPDVESFSSPFSYAEGQNHTTSDPDFWTPFVVTVDQFASHRNDYLSNETTAEVKMLGRKIGQLSLGTLLEFPDGYNANLTNVVVEPIEYWPYDPNDGGGPIYDSTTGEKLRFDRGMGPPWSSQ
jgi:hypothetical protein